MSGWSMYRTCGYFACPITVCVGIAYLKFFMQLALYFGTSMLGGAKAMIAKNNKSKLNLSVLSCGFQILGLISMVVANYTLMSISQPWCDWGQLQVFSYLISQHTSTTTLIVGITYDFVVLQVGEAEPSDYLDGPTAAKWLFISAIIVGIPVWVAIMVSICTCYGLGLLIASVLPVLATVLHFELKNSPGQLCAVLKKMQDRSILYQNALILFIIISLPLFLSIIWFCLNPLDLMSWLLMFTTILAYYMPLLLLIILTGQMGLNKPSTPYFYCLEAFVASLGVTYIIVMLVPTCILASLPSSHDVTKSAAEIFRGKQIDKYIADQFIIPTQAKVENGAELLESWLIYISGFFT